MALNEATIGFLTQLAASGSPPLHTLSPEAARKVTAGMRELFGRGPEMIRVEELKLPTPNGSIPGRLLIPTAHPSGVIVYLHGGGWVLGSADECDTLGRKLAAQTGCAVVLVDYRLAPEHPYPAAVDDAWAAVLWVADNMKQIAGASVPLIVAGDSAGGNLAALVAQRARANGGPRIDLQVLVYPVTDCVLDGGSYLDPSNQLLVSRESVGWFWELYLPDPERRLSPDVSPARATDLLGLPPALVVTAEHDVLRDEGEAYAARLTAAGVPVEHKRFEGEMHTFFTMVNLLPGSAKAIDYVAEGIVRRLQSTAWRAP